MKYPFFLVLLVWSVQLCTSQENHLKVVDSLYKEDQFYTGITYNLIDKKPSGLSQTGFSLGFTIGYIKDMPINKARNKAFGVGLGYALDSYNHNLFIAKDTAGDFTYSVLSSGSDFTKNKFSFHLLELPIEYRWRTSTPTNDAFWRIYAGVKFGYVFVSRTKYSGDLGEFKYINNSDFEDIQYGLTFSAGYNTWNFHVNYLLNPILSKNAKIDDTNIDASIIKIGLMFYIL